MSKLEELFNHRHEQHNKITQDILRTLKPVTECIVEFVKASEPEEEAVGSFCWDDVAHLYNENNSELSGIVVFIGSVSYKQGTILPMDDGSFVEINNDTVDYFKRIVRIGIPFDLAESGDKTKIFQFLHETASQIYSHSDNADEFDAETLSEEQQEALSLCSYLSGEKTN